jgi:hypothetical protein
VNGIVWFSLIIIIVNFSTSSNHFEKEQTEFVFMLSLCPFEGILAV